VPGTASTRGGAYRSGRSLPLIRFSSRSGGNHGASQYLSAHHLSLLRGPGSVANS
jgi:hypothetical protein